METLFTLKNGVSVKDTAGGPALQFTDEEYRELMAGEERYLMTEANTMADLEATFFYDSPLLWEGEQMMEAVTTSRLHLARTMKAFVRALNQKLRGTNLQAGSTATGGPAQDGTSVIGGADVGRARNINGLPVLPAIIPISDGQTVSILFHSPTADGKIAQDDTLVAFQFLLNKKDVTHAVAPIGGQDLTLTQVTMKLSNLLEKNTVKFQRAQKKQKALIDEINQLQADSDSKEDALHTASDQAAAAWEQSGTLQQQLDGIISQAEALESENASMQSQIDAIVSAGMRNVTMPDPAPVAPTATGAEPSAAPVLVSEAPPSEAEGNNIGNGYVSVKPEPEVAAAIANEIEALGIAGGVPADKLHVTLMYSKNNAIRAEAEPERVYKASLTGHYEIMGDAPWRALVAHIYSSDLQQRFDELSAAGGEHSFPEYNAHISLKYDPLDSDLELLQSQGISVVSVPLSGETFKPIKDDVSPGETDDREEEMPQIVSEFLQGKFTDQDKDDYLDTLRSVEAYVGQHLTLDEVKEQASAWINAHVIQGNI